MDFKGNKIKFPRLKFVKAKIHRKFAGNVKSAAISQVPGGEKYENPKTLQKYSNELTKLQRQLAHKEKYSNNYYKVKKRIALCHELTRQLEYKAAWNERKYIKIDTFYASSQLCSCCGYQNKGTKDLSVRRWICPKCSTEHDRDVNAAKNILAEGLRQIA